MDLTSLSSNLPRNPPHPEETAEGDEEPSSTLLMSAFKQAAYSVTTLYKLAGEQVERARRDGQKEGQQECLDDLLALLQRLDGKVDSATREIVKQWALGKRRKLGTRPARREERETSSESDVLDPQRSSPPVEPHQPEPQQQQHPSPPLPSQQQQQQQQQQQAQQARHVDPGHATQMQINSPRRSSPPLPPTSPAPLQLPQLASFNFSQTYHMPRHIPPPPETSDLDIPDNDSPPTSPRMAPQATMFQHHGAFQQTKPFGVASHNHANGSRHGHGHGHGHGGRHHSRVRAGTKRRFESFDGYFDMAAAEMEKMQHMGKKGRFQ